MTTINGQPQTPPVPAKDKQIETKSGEFLNGHTAQHQRGNTNQGTGGHARSNSSLLVSQSALEQLLDTPPRQQGNQGDTTDDSEDQGRDEDTAQVLITLTPEKPVGKDAPVLQPATAANLQIKTDEIAKLVSRQMDAALRSGPVVTPQPISLAIPLDAATGLKEVHVVMNDGVLTVTVLRSADQAAHDIKQAAMNLAQTLQSRYPTKTIKVAQMVEGSADEIDGAAQTDAPQSTQPHLFNILSHDKFP